MSLEKFLLKLSQETPPFLAKAKKAKDFGQDQFGKTIDSLMGSPRSAIAGALGGAGGAAAYFNEDEEDEEDEEKKQQQMLRLILEEG